MELLWSLISKFLGNAADDAIKYPFTTLFVFAAAAVLMDATGWVDVRGDDGRIRTEITRYTASERVRLVIVLFAAIVVASFVGAWFGAFTTALGIGAAATAPFAKSPIAYLVILFSSFALCVVALACRARLRNKRFGAFSVILAAFGGLCLSYVGTMVWNAAHQPPAPAQKTEREHAVRQPS